MAQYTTYDQIGQAEDVSKVISNITPLATPFQTAIGEEKAKARLHQWQEDELDAVGTMAHVEGADFSAQALRPTVMRGNYTQIMSKTIRVSATADAIETHGRAKETAYQLAKKGQEFKRDLEHTLIGIEQNAAVGDASTNPRLMGNVWGTDANGDKIIDAAVVNDNAGTPRPLDEASVLDVLQKLYNEGSEADTLMIKPADSLVVAGWATTTASGATVRSRDFGEGQKVVNAVNVYVSPFGTVKVVLNRFIKQDSALAFKASNWKKVNLRPVTRTLLAKTGDGDTHALVAEMTLKHVNYKSTGAITDLT